MGKESNQGEKNIINVPMVDLGSNHDIIFQEEIFDKEQCFNQNKAFHLQTLFPEIRNEQIENSKKEIADENNRNLQITQNLQFQDREKKLIQQNKNQYFSSIEGEKEIHMKGDDRKYLGEIMQKIINQQKEKALKANQNLIQKKNKLKNKSLFRFGVNCDQNEQFSNKCQDSQINSLQNNKVQYRIEEEKRLLKEENYFLKEYLAQGGEGMVFGGYYLNEDNQQDDVVFKCIKQYDLISLLKEIKIMKLFVSNPCIVKLVDSIVYSEDIYILVLEKCQSTLTKELNNIINKKQFSLEKLIQMILDLLDGLIQLRIYNILHLDIKLDNILVTKSGDHVYSDFGISYNFKDKIIETDSIGYTEGYAPEEQVLQQTKYIGYKSDVYSLGIAFLKIIKAYKDVNGNDINNELISKFEHIILENMTHQNINDIPKRKECEILHKLFLDEIPNDKIYFEKYFKKLSKIISTTEYDHHHDNRDHHYLQDIKLYYLELQRKINFDLFGNQIELAHQYFNIGKQYYFLGEYDKALDNTLKSLDLKQNIFTETDISIALTLGLIGNCYVELKDFSKALENCIKSNKMLTDQYPNCKIEIATSLNNIKRCYQGQNDYQNAFKYLIEYIKISYLIVIDNSEPFEFPVQSQLFSQQNYIFYSELQVEMMKLFPQKDQQSISDLLGEIGKLYFLNSDLQNSLDYEKQSLKIKSKIYKTGHLKMQYLTLGNLFSNENKNFEIDQQLFNKYEGSLNETLYNSMMNFKSFDSEENNTIKKSLQGEIINFTRKNNIQLITCKIINSESTQSARIIYFNKQSQTRNLLKEIIILEDGSTENSKVKDNLLGSNYQTPNQEHIQDFFDEEIQQVQNQNLHNVGCQINVIHFEGTQQIDNSSLNNYITDTEGDIKNENKLKCVDENISKDQNILLTPYKLEQHVEIQDIQDLNDLVNYDCNWDQKNKQQTTITPLREEKEDMDKSPLQNQMNLIVTEEDVKKEFIPSDENQFEQQHPPYQENPIQDVRESENQQNQINKIQNIEQQIRITNLKQKIEQIKNQSLKKFINYTPDTKEDIKNENNITNPDKNENKLKNIDSNVSLLEKFKENQALIIDILERKMCFLSTYLAEGGEDIIFQGYKQNSLSVYSLITFSSTSEQLKPNANVLQYMIQAIKMRRKILKRDHHNVTSVKNNINIVNRLYQKKYFYKY